jgi:hypothetical protein
VAVEITATVTYTNWPFDKGLPANARRVRKWLRKGVQATATYWRDKFLPLHFKSEAHGRYAGVYYRRRSKGTNRPLVSSGQLRRETKNAAITLRRSKAVVRARVKLATEHDFKRIRAKRGRKNTWEQYREELTAMNDAELDVLQQVMLDAVGAEIDNFKSKTRKRLK